MRPHRAACTLSVGSVFVCRLGDFKSVLCDWARSSLAASLGLVISHLRHFSWREWT